jgi:hypothetical protein
MKYKTNQFEMYNVDSLEHMGAIEDNQIPTVREGVYCAD